MVIGTYNNQSIIALPTNPAPRQIELGMNDANALSVSPFTGSTQVQAWPGADYWDADIALPKLLPQDAAVWSAFLAECRGMLNVFYLSDPSYKQPQGNVSGVPVANGAQSPMATTLATKGWTPTTFGLLLPGDYLQVGNRLHRVLEPVNSDVNGDATIVIWPSLRDAVTDGQTIILDNPQGLFRLASNRRSLTSDYTLLTATSFKAVEAR